MKKTPACDPAPAPAPVRDRSQFVAGTVIVLCIVALTLGYIFTTADRAVPTSTAVTTAATPAQLETTTSTTTKAPDIPGRIVCFTEEVNEDTSTLKKICTQVVVLINFDENGKTDRSLKTLQPMKNSFLTQFLIGTKFQEDQKLKFFEAVGKSRAWTFTTSHALTAVSLRDATAQKLQIAAIKLQKIEVMCLLATSQVKATVDALPFIRGLEVVAVTPECDAYQWNRKEELAFVNAIQGRVGLVIALSFSAALWEAEVHGKAGKEQCTDWIPNSKNIKRCLRLHPIEQCQAHSIFVRNDTIAKMVQYAKSKAINAFAIRNADQLIDTLELNRQFHLLNFTLPGRQGVPTKDTQQRAIQLLPPGVHDWASSESGGEVVTADSSAGFETEQAETDYAVVGAEHQSKADMVKKTSSKAAANSAANLLVSGKRSLSSSTVSREGSKKSSRKETKRPIKKASSSAHSVNYEGATETT